MSDPIPSSHLEPFHASSPAPAQPSPRAEHPLPLQTTHSPDTLPPHHTLTLRTTLGALVLDAHLDLRAPWTVLFGPSGSGKSTLLRAIAGVLRTPHTFLRHAPSADLTHTPPHLRHIAWAPQHAALFPHLTVAENIAFSLRATGHTRDHASRDLVRQATSLLALDPLLHRRPRDLSGGERQLVSLARALAVPGARLLLLDEPFSNLDRATRDDLIPHLQTHLAARNLPVLSVTHDVEEAFLLHPEVLLLAHGHITARGPAAQVLSAERQRTLANLTQPPPL